MQEQPTRIMVVDGSEVARTIIARILHEEMAGASIVTCGTVAEALEFLEQEDFDLICTSLMLPDRDGLELSREIRNSRRHHYTPVIVISGDADTRLLREGFASGVTDYFDKSLGYQAFADFVKEFTERNAGMVGRILYVEDSPSAATYTIRLMERHGLQVVHTTTAEEALEQLRLSAPGGPCEHQAFDILVTDFYLKGTMTGGDLLHAVRAKFHYSQQEMPVLMITVAENEEKQVEVFHAGANDFVTKPIVEETLMARIRSLLLIKQQFVALKRQSETMHRLAITDTLTRVYNKRYLLDHGDQFLANRRNHPVSALLLDIDHFKKINDNLGHITGDRVLETLGQLLKERIPADAMAVRFGGEEFALLVPRCNLRDAHTCAERLRADVEALHPADIPITISVGLACTQNQPDISLTQLLSLADKALYAAKDRGRNRVCA